MHSVCHVALQSGDDIFLFIFTSLQASQTRYELIRLFKLGIHRLVAMVVLSSPDVFHQVVCFFFSPFITLKFN